MNTPNRHLSYRRQVYRRRRLRLILTILGVLLALLLVGFLVIGNLLNLRQKSNEGGETESDSSTGAAPDLPTRARSVNAYGVALKTNDSSTFSTRLGTLKNQGLDTASVPLNRRDGGLLYRSSLAASLGVSAEATSLDNAMETAEALGIYVSGTFYLTAFSEEDELLRSVILSREAALLAEALRAGVDDVLLIAPDFGAEHLVELSRFLSTVRSLAPDGVLGFALSSELLATDEASALSDTLSRELNFLALDLTDAEDREALENGMSGSLYYLLRYQMRVLLPQKDSETQTSWIEAVKENGVSNWQILSEYAIS